MVFVTHLAHKVYCRKTCELFTWVCQHILLNINFNFGSERNISNDIVSY